MAQDAGGVEDSQAVTLRWGKYANHCLDFSHQADAGFPGMALQLWDCAEDRHDRDRFLIPSPGQNGPVRPENFPSLCLQAADPSRLTFATCHNVPEDKKIFALRAGADAGYHHLHLLADMSQCLDIPDDNRTNGAKVMLWHCRKVRDAEGEMSSAGTNYAKWSPEAPGVTDQQRLGDELILIERAPVDCLWASWSSWSSCSEICGPGQSMRYRAIGREAAHGGYACAGNWSEARRCMRAECPPEPVLATSPWLPWLLVAIGLLCLLCLLVPLFAECARRRRQRHDARHVDHAEEDERLVLLQQLQEGDSARSGRDQEGWLRVEVMRKQREEHLRLLAESQGRMLRETCIQTDQEFTCPAGHTLRPPLRGDRRWICNGRRAPGGCRSGITTFGLHEVERFRCEACDYDLCGACGEAAGRQYTSTSPSGAEAQASKSSRRWRLFGGKSKVSTDAQPATSAEPADEPTEETHLL
eukprot:CAMPEP_0176021672 /NCGR_PEP_ID=MMETSP0120_2-20121206/10528_1 /TAXON_ID=160619 /ORGANISM="Kryptoperidinium foliaceum, Strain CCMP 1326" /LENGTH=470 /DNA_ID=CAMNT_0017354789 /DNA_START=54 /DNA_END=1463 /DNA_ORIENTATION=+